MFKPGDVVGLHSEVAGKRKYHLCIHVGGGFLFLNSPKVRSYAGDLLVDCDEFPFLPATDNGKSVISCSMVLRYTARQLARGKAERLGACSKNLLMTLIREVEASEVLSDEDRDFLLDGLSDGI